MCVPSGLLSIKCLLFLFCRSHPIITRGNPPNHGQDCVGEWVWAWVAKKTLTYLAKIAFLFLMHSVFPTAIELTCLIESISTNNPRIEWKKIKNGVPSYVYFQNRIAGKPLERKPIHHSTESFQSNVSGLKLSWINGTLKELGIEFCFPNCEVRLCIWMSNCKVFFPSFKRGLGPESSAQRAGQHPDLQRHPLWHCRVPLWGGRHRRSERLWWDTD